MKFQERSKTAYTLATFQLQIADFNLESVRHYFQNQQDKKQIDFMAEILEKMQKAQLAILTSMTLQEKLKPDVLNLSRMQRIANGSGTQVTDVEGLIKTYRLMKKKMKRPSPTSPGDEPPPAMAAVMAIPKEPEKTKAIGLKR